MSNREILFRGKRKDNGEWMYGDLLREKDVFDVIRTKIFEIRGSGYFAKEEIIPETRGQYTGFVDFNGTKIFEGDIVAFDDCTNTESGYCEQNCRGEVIWDAETGNFQVTGRLLAESYEVFVNCIIIGNIHDNPDLLKGE